MIPIFNTYIDKKSENLILDVLRSTHLSEGKIVKEFESELEKKLNIMPCLTVNSGTSALHLALEVAGIKKGDEVIIPAQTFIATGLVVLQCGAKAVFADIDYATGNISANSIKTKITNKTKAIIPVHWGGYPCDMDEILSVAKEHNLIVIDDAAHAIGAEYKGNAIGNISDMTCFSFQAIKHLTTGDGGAISFKNNKHFETAFERRWFGINREKDLPNELGERQYDLKEIGYKYHLNNYAAALGLANLSSLKNRITKRAEIASLYSNGLSKVAGVTLFENKNDRKSAYWLFGFHIEKRLDFIRKMKENKITVSVIHQRIDKNSLFGTTNDLPQQELFDATQIHIPMHDEIDKEKAEYIIQTIKAGW